MQRIGFERLDALMPLLLDAVAGNEAPDTALERVQPLIEAVLRRTAYLALLRENPQALEHLMRLCAASPDRRTAVTLSHSARRAADPGNAVYPRR